MSQQHSGVTRLAGAALAAVGVAHLANPRLFTPLTRRAFPRRTRLYTYANGVAATAIGIGIRNPRTRGSAMVMGVGYGAHLSGRAARTARRRDRAPRYHAAARLDPDSALRPDRCAVRTRGPDDRPA